MNYLNLGFENYHKLPTPLCFLLKKLDAEENAFTKVHRLIDALEQGKMKKSIFRKHWSSVPAEENETPNRPFEEKLKELAKKNQHRQR